YFRPWRALPRSSCRRGKAGMSESEPVVGVHDRYPYLFTPSLPEPPGEGAEIRLSRTLERLLLLTGNIILAYQFREARDDEEMGARVRQYLAEPSRDRLSDLHITALTLRPAWLRLLLGLPGGDDAIDQGVRSALASALESYRRLLEARDNSYGTGGEIPPDLLGVEARLVALLQRHLSVDLRARPGPDGSGLELVRDDLVLPLFPFCLVEAE